MKHSLDELLDIVYRYYPRGIGNTDDVDIQRRNATEEHARLVAARRRAAADERWHTLRRRISERFPDAPLMNHSLHLPTGHLDACYSFTVNRPTAIDSLWFHVSFLVPYYFTYSWRLIEIVKQPQDFKVIHHGIRFYIQRSAVGPGLISNLEEKRSKSVTVKRGEISFDLSPDEQTYAEWIAREIERTFSCERMPPEVGTVLVPDVAANLRGLGEARLYDCLFTDQHEWVNPSPSEVQAPAVEVNASDLTEPFIAVLTVLAALAHIAWALMPEAQGAFLGAVTTDGVLHKEEVLKALAKIRLLIEPPMTPRGTAAKRELEAATRELEALVAAWDGEGAPPDAMVAWASRFLAGDRSSNCPYDGVKK